MTAACPDLGCDNRRVSPQVLDMRCIIDVTHVTHDDQGLDGREDSTTSFSTIFDHVPPRRDASSGCAADPGPSGLNPRNLPLSDGTRLLQVLPRCVKKSLSSTRLVSPSQASAIEVSIRRGSGGMASGLGRRPRGSIITFCDKIIRSRQASSHVYYNHVLVVVPQSDTLCRASVGSRNCSRSRW